MRYLQTLQVSAVQVITVILGVSWGLAKLRPNFLLGDQRLLPLAGVISIGLLGCDGLRFFLLRHLASTSKATPCLCAALACLGVTVMLVDPLFWYDGNNTFFIGVVLVSTFLVFIGPLVRTKAWLGVLGAALFSVTLLAILTANGFTRYSGTSFWGTWIS
jgi:hypothetical protein